MTIKDEVVAEQNPYNGTWEVGWRSEDGEFTPHFCGYPTKEAAAAEIPNFDERLKAEMQVFMAEMEAGRREEVEQHINIAHVRAQIKKLYDSRTAKGFAAAFDADSKLDWLLNMDLHEHISWPLPSWKAIQSGRVYGR
jgi:hypothetical protein